jgi:hypothetical protein
MFLHPYCPCSRASLIELEGIMKDYPAAEAVVYFVNPHDLPEGTERSSNWREASRLPRTNVVCDEEGFLAQRWGIATSGHVIMRGASGHVLFSGGITRARGHLGDSSGSRAVRALLDSLPNDSSHSGDPLTAPVFGCPLFSPENGPGMEERCRNKEGSSIP